MGLLTFFFPLVSIDRPFEGRARWSPFNVVDEMYQGRLPKPTWCERCGEPMVSSLVALPFDVSLNYLMLVLALVALRFSESPGLLGGLAFIAAMKSGWAQNSHSTARGFAATLQCPIRQVHCGWLTVALLCSMAALFYISVTPVLDRTPSTNQPD